MRVQLESKVIKILGCILKASSLHHINEYMLQHEFQKYAWKCDWKSGLTNDSQIFREIGYH